MTPFFFLPLYKLASSSPAELARVSVCASEANSQHVWADGLSVLTPSASLTYSTAHSTVSAMLLVITTFSGKPTHKTTTSNFAAYEWL